MMDRMDAARIAPPSPEDPAYCDLPSGPNNRAVFLDRDGVLNEDTGYPYRLDEMRLIDGAGRSIKRFRDLGFLVVVVTNQAGIGKGLYTMEEFISIMEWMKERLEREGDSWDRAYFCPYLRDAVLEEFRADHPDRKPSPGMLLRAAGEMGIDLSSSYLIGDHSKDIVAAHSAGCRAILVATGRGRGQFEKILGGESPWGEEAIPDIVARDIENAYHAIRELEVHERSDP